MSLRLRQIALVARRLAPVVDELREVFGIEVAYRDPAVAVFGLENSVLPIGSQFLEVVAPTREDTAAGRYLDRRGGDGGYMVILQCDDHPDRKRRVDELGIRKALAHDDADYRLMQLHPRDTGGSFLEIDQQLGGDPADDPWQPAGPSWKTAIRTGVVRAIAAAEIQSPGPMPLAKRWSAILERPLGANGGAPTIQLDDAAIRFVEATDGRGEGLGGVDVVAADRAHVVTAAKRRGLEVRDDVVLVCGVRFRLVDP
jgi:hypothetical protein